VTSSSWTGPTAPLPGSSHPAASPTGSTGYSSGTCPRPGASPHFHKTFSESFYILTGTVQLYDGENWADARPGDFLYVPRGGVHAFRNASDQPASMLILFAPGAPRENYFRETAQLAAAGRELSYDEWTELYTRHDQFRAE
jgi:mannose-6-phosphate isomerase-like protein (cupin superfamily)